MRRLPILIVLASRTLVERGRRFKHNRGSSRAHLT
jgi:hypothetical protein